MTVREQFLREAGKRILVKDGPYGTAIQNEALDEAGYKGAYELGFDQKGNNDLLNLTQPAIIAKICDRYIAAGAHVLATNTFNSTRISQADYGAEALVPQINRRAAEIIRERITAATQADGIPRFVAGAMGPTNKTLSLSPDVEDPGFREVTFDEVAEVYLEQASALLEGGADFILVETIFDTLNAKAAIMAVRTLAGQMDRDIPLMLSMTLTDLSGRNLSGHTVEAFWNAVRHAKPLTVGLNCSFGAEQLRPHIRVLSDNANTLVMAYPNAGLPNDLGEYDELPETTSALVREWAENGQVNVLGGCCGSTPEHIAAIARACEGLAPRPLPDLTTITRLAGLEPFEIAA
ncbi:homocysteine S-methyltransferase family protein [Altererythrobacter aquiaggeris]|uniref:homocysteine S-methyltransferase family protein n=1 Tax=Aestuarierythrobacter aquiaggeris TaxID=1898396 RepID=UPI0030171C2E